MERNKKKGLIISIYFAIFLAIGLFIFFVAKKDATCSDGIQNQREAGIDCGGPCAPCEVEIEPVKLEIKNAEIVYDIENKYDVVVTVANPNELLGAKNVYYRVYLYDGNGTQLAESQMQQGFILPSQEKYFIATGVIADQAPVEAKVEIESTDWEKFTNYKEPQLLVYNPNYETSTAGAPNFSQAKGTLINKTDIDFETIKVKVILRNSENKILAVNYQIMNTVMASEQRDFIISFYHSFPGSVAHLEIEPETNIFDSENYIKIQGRPERWDE